MSRKKRKKSHRWKGHYCWACSSILPNEKFSGGGHARHICRACAKLGAEELKYRQSLRDLERLMTSSGIIPRKHRKAFEQFLHHDDPRLRSLAEELAEEDRIIRDEWRECEAMEEAGAVEWLEQDEVEEWGDGHAAGYAARGCEQPPVLNTLDPF